MEIFLYECFWGNLLDAVDPKTFSILYEICILTGLIFNFYYYWSGNSVATTRELLVEFLLKCRVIGVKLDEYFSILMSANHSFQWARIVVFCHAR